MGISLLYGKAWGVFNILPKELEFAAAVVQVVTVEGVGGFLDLFQSHGVVFLPAKY